MSGIIPERPKAELPQTLRGGSAPRGGAWHRVPHGAYPANPPTPHSQGFKSHSANTLLQRKFLNRNLRIRLSEDEDKAVAALAQWCGEKTRSRLIRKLIRNAIGQGPDLLDRDLEVFREAVRQLGSLGRNINQIARALNSGAVAANVMDTALLSAVQSQVTAVQKEVMAVIERSKCRWVQNAR